MIGSLIFGILFFAAVGSFINYVGVSLIVEAFNFAGGSAIELFCGGIVLAIMGVACFVALTLCGKALLEEIKEKLNDRP